MESQFCNTHGQQYPFMFLNINPDAPDKSNFKLLCNKCIVEEKFKKGFLICIDDINKDDKQNQIVYNWPPSSNNRDLVKKIEDILSESGEDEASLILQELEKKYDKLKQIVNEKIDEYYKYSLNIVNTFSKSYLQEAYKKVSNLENFKSCFDRERLFDLNKFQDILNEQTKKMEQNTKVFQFILKQYTQIKKQGLKLFDTLLNKLEILFFKIDSQFINRYEFINIADETNQENIEKALFIENANQNLGNLHQQIKFKWQTFEEILNGIQLQLNEKSVLLTKGYKMSQNIKDLDQGNFKNSYKWWIQVSENSSQRKQFQQFSKEQQILFSKKAKEYFQSDFIKGKQKIVCKQHSLSKDFVNDTIEFAKQIMSNAQKINDQYSKQNLSLEKQC